MTHPTLNERAQHLLKVLIEHYLEDGSPVGSRTLSRESTLALSPATIRNVMADLEDLGLVTSPHTSAGRVPTHEGLRFFVDSLITVEPLEKALTRRMQHELLSGTGEGTSSQLVATASNLLSGITHLAGLVTLPRQRQALLHQIEFLPLSNRRVLVVLVTGEREVQNRIIEVEKEFDANELTRAANFLNRHYRGRPLDAIQHDLLQDLRQVREDIDQRMMSALALAEQALDKPENRDGDFVVAGQTNLIGLAELSSMQQLKQLFEAFQEKRSVLHLLDRCERAEGVQIFIGHESGYQAFDQCSLVTAPYYKNEEPVGVLGVIGPTRIHYERIIPVVDATARILTAALNSRE